MVDALSIRNVLLAIEIERIKAMYLDRERECDQLEVSYFTSSTSTSTIKKYTHDPPIDLVKDSTHPSHQIGQVGGPERG